MRQVLHRFWQRRCTGAVIPVTLPTGLTLDQMQLDLGQLHEVIHIKVILLDA